MSTEEIGKTEEVNEAGLPRALVARTGRAKFRTRIDVRDHVLEVDEPESLGGQDVGMSPFDLVCAALASCTTITLRMYADRKGWALEEVGAHVEHQRVSADDSDPSKLIDRFSVRLELVGELDEPQRARLAEIAGRCPVHRTLVGGSIVQLEA